MNVAELAQILDAKVLNPGVDLNREVESGYVCDLLSWVMAKGAPGCAWITVMNHMNVIAVATLLDMACVILPENIAIEQATLDKATEEESWAAARPPMNWLGSSTRKGSQIP